MASAWQEKDWTTASLSPRQARSMRSPSRRAGTADYWDCSRFGTIESPLGAAATRDRSRRKGPPRSCAFRLLSPLHCSHRSTSCPARPSWLAFAGYGCFETSACGVSSNKLTTKCLLGFRQSCPVPASGEPRRRWNRSRRTMACCRPHACGRLFSPRKAPVSDPSDASDQAGTSPAQQGAGGRIPPRAG